ncbi:MAG TPA: hypothetical protein VL989_01405 [Candidatus Sulfotelmatobacter sp.]|nr:hypothetical protein [Candidatus Sulfotelmatobacter sp.]
MDMKELNQKITVAYRQYTDADRVSRAILDEIIRGVKTELTDEEKKEIQLAENKFDEFWNLLRQKYSDLPEA